MIHRCVRSIRLLAQASTQLEAVETLDLRACEALQCRSMMCAKFGSACVCKLSRVVEQCAPRLTALRTLVLADNELTMVPDSLWGIASLEAVDLSGNILERVPGGVASLANLRSLNLRANRICTADAAGLESLPPTLRTLRVGGNPAALKELQARCAEGGSSAAVIN